MSNPEAAPEETLCADRERASAAQQPMIIEPRDVPLGGVRAMSVRRTLPQRARSFVGAWCFLDHYGPDDVAHSGGMDVAAHPHTGLQTVSWLFSGEIEHRDSAGHHAFVRPGELNLMTAGRGISHSERSTAATTVLHGAQLWVALPRDAADTDPGFAHYEPPVKRGLGWAAQVFLGELLGEASPVPTFSPLVGAELRLEPGAVLPLRVSPAFEHAVLVDAGAVSLTRGSGEHAQQLAIAPAELGFAPLGVDTICLTTGPDGARVLLIGGEPLGEELIMWWNFMGRSHEDIARARADWQGRIAAAGVPDPAVTAPSASHPGAELSHVAPVDPHRFALPDDEPAPPLPAPPLPITRLVPRRQP
ncbi:pirin family protein [Leucobacter chromiireducens]|uniref:pirin family protein n=1 Tax=Leucobacter chromiireducens TaxID=283877 RepID=UPI000F63850A|nr:pirin family protein [Leucobacter chromiireducens]